MLLLACVLCALSADPPPAGETATAPVSAAPAAQVTPPALTLEPTDQDLLLPQERRHLQNIRQLTFGHSPAFDSLPYPANYAEAYWAPDGIRLILQSTRDEFGCDQEFVLDLVTGSLTRVSAGTGRVTCGYFTGNGERCIFASTHETLGAECPPPPDMSHGYVWAIYDYDIYQRDGLDPVAPLRNLTSSPGYDAEGTVDWSTGWLYFTSTRDGDLDVYRMLLDTGEVQRLTNDPGYDGGPFVSYDGKQVVYRRTFFKDDAERVEYETLLAQGLVHPTRLDLMMMNADGGGKRRLTDNGKANFAPFLHPDNKTLIFASNMDDPQGRQFDLYTLDATYNATNAAPYGTPERITFAPDFDGFPMFSPNGKYLVWCSNRNGSRTHETNVFVAEWIP